MNPWWRAKLNALLGKPGLPCPTGECPVRPDGCTGRIFPITLRGSADRPLGADPGEREDRHYWKCDGPEVFFEYKGGRFVPVSEQTG